MNKSKETGIYFHIPPVPHHKVDYNELIKFFAANKDYFVFSSDNIPFTSHKALSKIIRKNVLSTFLIVSEEYELLAMVFRKLFNEANKNKTTIKSLNISKLNGPGPLSTTIFQKAIEARLIGERIKDKRPHSYKVKANTTLVVGAGIAGIQAALEIADSGNKVVLIEKNGTIGGHMAMFDKTFPTLDCAACILTPKMASVAHHPNIEIFTLSEIKSIAGVAGDFHIKVLKQPRRVDEKKCVGCGICSENCPGRAPSDFDAGTMVRKSIYMPFPQAVPNKYLVDPKNCLYIKNGKCRNCEKVCPVEGCINLDESSSLLDFHVGNIIVATGFEAFDPSNLNQYGYKKFPNVVTSLELERLINSSGPTSGNIRTRSMDKRGNWIFDIQNPEPKSFAIIHCIGSRDVNYSNYCSRVCCMYSLKLSHLLKEKIPEAVVYEHFIDMRAFGKGYEEFYERIKNEGINFIRGKVSEIEEADDKLIIKSEDIEKDKLLKYAVDMVVLSVGIKPSSTTDKLAKIFGIGQDNNGWFKEENLITGSFKTDKPGIYLAGTCQGPKDIPDSVVHASSAAASVIRTILSDRKEEIALETTASK